MPAATVLLFGVFSLFAAMPTMAPAQHTHAASPYAHTQSAEFATLTPDEVHELRNGEGMGLARAAELNSFPGPRHLLDLKTQLGLEHAQVARIEEIHAIMKTRAVAKGNEILQAERHLANLFASGRPSASGSDPDHRAPGHHARPASGRASGGAHRECPATDRRADQELRPAPRVPALSSGARYWADLAVFGQGIAGLFASGARVWRNRQRF